MEKSNWYKLDNVGKFYASIKSRKIPNVFRFSATLKDDIDELTLLEALKETLIIFPNFNVTLRQGLFWYYLEETTRDPIVTEERHPIADRLYNSSEDLLYRVNYYQNRINFEVSHIISDGKGTMDFFKTLISNYVALKYKVKVKTDVDSSLEEKIEDSFDKYYKRTKLPEKSGDKIYRLKYKKLKNHLRFMEMHVSTKEVIDLAHKYNATLTSFLISVLILSFRDELKEKDINKTIKVDVPVDLRRYFKSTSTKNFFGLTSVSYKFNSREDELKDIIKVVNEQLKVKLTKEKLSQRMNLMIAFEKNPICRVVPTVIKDLVLLMIDSFIIGKSTTCLSNVGIADFGDKVNKYVEEVNVVNSTDNFQLVVCSYQDILTIGISSIYKNNNVIKNFCRYFANEGLDVTINVNEV